MKRLKKKTNAKTVLALLLLLIIGITIVAICTTNKSKAGSYDNGDCTVCTYEDGCCIICGYQHQNHTYEGGYCTVCYDQHPYTQHTGGTHENGWKCTICGVVYQEHSNSWISSGHEETDTHHTPTYKCTNENCTEVYKDEPEVHQYDEQEGGENCTVCGHQHQNHTYEDGKCTECYYQPPYAHHTGGTHKNGGKCTTCGAVYQTHSNSWEVSEYNETDTHHTPTYKCTNENCTEVYTGETEVHNYDEQDGGEVCTVCGHQHQNHTYEDGKCTECYYQPPYTHHTGGTHKNGGKCTTCGAVYQTHSNSWEVSEYNETDTHHTPTYKCTYENCKEVYTGETEVHQYDEQEGGENCTVCGHQHQNHTYEDGKCTECYYQPPYTHHTGGTHKNGGKCTTCGAVYQTHLKSWEVSEYNETDTHHTLTYKCTYENCKEVYKGEPEVHQYDEQEGGENCTVCGYRHKNHTYKNGYCTECYYQHDFRDHTGGTHKNGGKCTTCGEIYQIHGKSTTKGEVIKTDTHHTLTYKCTNENCTEVYKDEPEVHQYDYAKWAGECKICYYKHQNHTYEDGRCTVCYLRQCEVLGHTGGTHENEGKCTICGTVYQEHEWKYAPYQSIDDRIHRVLQTCMYDGCDVEREWHDDHRYVEGKCLDCGKQHESHYFVYYEGIGGYACLICDLPEEVHYKKHSDDFDFLRYEVNELRCTSIWKCEYGECPSLIERYDEHSYPKGSDNPKFDGLNTHTVSKICENCGYHFVDSGKKCFGGSHENGGRCRECKGQYENHSTIVTYDGSGQIGVHYAYYICSMLGCNFKILANPYGEECYGMSHETGGRCTACGLVREEHKPRTEIVDWEYSNTHHTPLLDCGAIGCTKTYRGMEEPHILVTYVDKYDGTHVAKCRSCGFEVRNEHNYEETEDELPDDNIGYNEVIGGNIGGVLPPGLGSCADCGALASAADNGCEHTYISKNDETQHWEECEKCHYIKVGTLEEHKHTTYKDNNDGTHTSECTVCKYKLNKEHYYEDGVCVECNRAVSQECEHEYVLNHNNEKHWAQCKKCEKVLEEGSGAHDFETYIYNEDGTHTAICKLCMYELTEKHPENCDKCEKETTSDGEQEDNNKEEGKEDKEELDKETEDKEETKDDTIIDAILPDTGISKIIVSGIIILSISIAVGIIKMKKYKGI